MRCVEESERLRWRGIPLAWEFLVYVVFEAEDDGSEVEMEVVMEWGMAMKTAMLPRCVRQEQRGRRYPRPKRLLRLRWQL